MTIFLNKKILLALALVFIFATSSPVYAANLTVDFNPDPLFNVGNFLPGDVSSGNVTVTNGIDTSQSIYAESINGYDPDSLSSRMRLRIMAGATERYNSIFSNFLTGGPVLLSSLDALDTTTYTFEVSFIDSTDNDYQEKSLGFDLCIGFSGGNFQCGDTVVGETEGPFVDIDSLEGDGGGGGVGGGGGGSGDFSHLIIFNEVITSVLNGTAIVEWDTNLLSTSQVIYGLSSGAPYTLDLNLVNFGYPLGTLESGVKVNHHTVLLAGLIGGETYVYRVVSRASPPTISVEHSFTVPTSGNVFIEPTEETPEAQNVLGALEEGVDSSGNGVTSSKETLDNSNSLLALALGGLGFDARGLFYIGYALIIFLIILGLWIIWRRRQKNKGK